jgi:hypothetical protein
LWHQRQSGGWQRHDGGLTGFFRLPR